MTKRLFSFCPPPDLLEQLKTCLTTLKEPKCLIVLTTGILIGIFFSAIIICLVIKCHRYSLQSFAKFFPPLFLFFSSFVFFKHKNTVGDMEKHTCFQYNIFCTSFTIHLLRFNQSIFIHIVFHESKKYGPSIVAAPPTELLILFFCE